MGSNSVLTTLIQDAILKLCTQNVLFDASLEIDGIICISPGQESKEIVVKMHRTIMKPTPEPEVFQPEPSPKGTPHRRNRNQQAHSSNIESDTFPVQTSNISFDEMPKHDTYQDESGGATAYFPDEQQQYDTTPSKQSRKRRQPQTPTDTSSEEKYIKVEPGEGEILVEEPTNMPAAGESNDSYSDTSQGLNINFTDPEYLSQPANMQLGPTNLLLGPANMQPGPANMQPGPANMPTEPGPSWPANMSRPKNLLGLAAKIPGDEGDIFTLDTSINTCCGLDFPSKACMEHHTMVVHNRFCEVCNSRIDSDKDAANHGLLHKGVKAYQCQFCYKLLGSNSGLKTHMTPDVMCKMCNKLVSFTNRRRHICVKSAKK